MLLFDRKILSSLEVLERGVFFVFEVVGAGMKWRGGGMRGKGGIRGWRQEQGGGAAPLLLLLQCFTTSIPLCSTQSCTVSRSSAPLGFPVKQPYTEYDTLTVHCSSQEHTHTHSITGHPTPTVAGAPCWEEVRSTQIDTRAGSYNTFTTLGVFHDLERSVSCFVCQQLRQTWWRLILGR